MSDNRLIFTPTFEGLFILSAKGRFNEAARNRLRAAGLDIDRPLLPGYPAAVFTDTVRIAAEELFPGVEREQAVRQVGRLSLEGYANTLVGRALFGILRLIGTRRAMLRLSRNMAGGTNFLQATAEEVGPTEFRATINDVTGLPTFYQGVLEQAASLLGTHAQLTLEDHPAPGCAYRMKW